MSKQLTVEMIIKRARGNTDLSSITKLNFWGQSLSDISILSQCISLESATFSQNFISSLRCFQGMNYLRELSLARNNIKDFRELSYLGTCPNLIKLWLKDNPISKKWDYRIQVISFIPQLKFLDDEEITPDERNIANTGSFMGQMGQNYEIKKKENLRPPSHDPFRAGGGRYRNNFEQYGGVYNRLKIDYESEEINYNNNNNYLGILPGMVDENQKYINDANKYGKFQKPRADTPGKVYDRYGNGRRGITPNNNYHYEDEGIRGRKNNNNINVERHISYNNYGRNIPGSAQSHYRKYGNNNQMEVSTTSTQQGQQGIIDCVSVLLKGLTKDELLYIVEHIDKKISKI